MADTVFRPSPFFDPGPVASPDSLAILHLKRDQLVPVVLHASADHANGYAEGAVTNTRFGSFPHSTLVERKWGSQVRASIVDTGSRGRQGTKRKREGAEGDFAANEADGLKTAITAGTGFIHLLPPTPESWTLSLPHRTQVVYTPDYSYVLQRLRVKPGQTIIEAGAGSGSFTHAAARAVFSGHPSAARDSSELVGKKDTYGKVCSFEYHEPRAIGLRKELDDHGLSDIVHVTHRDVCEDGFTLEHREEKSPKANAVFLDLPAPWTALKHLTRQKLSPRLAQRAADPDAGPAPEQDGDAQNTPAFVSPLDPNTSIHLCTFNPCIEQVQSAVSALRQLGWTEIEMVEVAQRRIDVRRERVGLHEEGLRGVNASASNVEEAVQRLREVEGRFKEWHEHARIRKQEPKMKREDSEEEKPKHPGVKQERLDRIKREAEGRKTFKEGNLVHRTEPDVKTHTSYLVFAVLPREWSEEDEARCLEQWGDGPSIKSVEGKEKQAAGGEEKLSKRAAKKAASKARHEAS